MSTSASAPPPRRPLDLGRSSATLMRNDEGIWTAMTARAGGLSFPEDGHEACYQIEDASFWFAHRNDCIRRALARHPFEGPFLDIGGGNGAVSKHLADHGFEVVLLEPGPSGAKNAKSRGLANVVCSTLDEAAFADSTFGGAGLFDVIEHVEDDAALLKSAHRVIRPGGVLAVTVPAYRWLWSAEDEIAGHFRRYTTGELRKVLEATGFEVAYLTYFFASLTVPVFMFRSVPHKVAPKREVATEETASQHTPNAAARKAMELALAPERAAIERGKPIPFGTSCLAIARRPA